MWRDRQWQVKENSIVLRGLCSLKFPLNPNRNQSSIFFFRIETEEIILQSI